MGLDHSALNSLFNSPSRPSGVRLAKRGYLPPSVIRLPLRVNMILSSRVSMDVTFFGAANSFNSATRSKRSTGLGIGPNLSRISAFNWVKSSSLESWASFR